MTFPCPHLRDGSESPRHALEGIGTPAASTLNQSELFREGILTGEYQAPSEVIMPLCGLFAVLQAVMQRPPRGALRTQVEVLVQILKGIPLDFLLFLRSCAFFITLASSSFCGLFQLYVNIPSQRKVLGQLCCLAEGRHWIGENLTAGTQGSEAAEERQEQVDSEATVGPRCFEKIVF